MTKSLTFRLVFALVFVVLSAYLLSNLYVLRKFQKDINEISNEMLLFSGSRLLPIIIADQEFRQSQQRRYQDDDDDDDDDDEDEDEDEDDDYYEKDGRRINYRVIAALFSENDDVNFVARNQAGEIIIASQNLGEEIPTIGLEGFSSDARNYYVTLFSPERKFSITMIEPRHIRDARIRQIRHDMYINTLLIAVLVALAIVATVKITLRPVKKFRLQIASRSAADLSKLDGTSLPSEIRPVADEMNALFEKLEASIENERRFARNSAHELKTPVAAALAKTQRLMAKLQSEEYKDGAEIEAALKRLDRIIEKLLQLAKAQGASVSAPPNTNLRPYLDIVLEDLRRVYPAHIFDTSQSTVEIYLPIDPDAFAIVARNLIENAAKYATHPEVQIIADNDGLAVENDCELISAQMFQSWRTAFSRGSDDEAGTGLGLSIVQAIAEGTGATLSFVSPIKDGRGIRVFFQI